MSCQRIAERAIATAVAPVVRGLKEIMQRHLNGLTGHYPGVTVLRPQFSGNLPQPVLQAAHGLGALIGTGLSAVIPNFANLQAPEWAIQQETNAMAEIIGKVLGAPPDVRPRIAREIDACITHMLQGLVSGHLVRHGFIKAGW